MDRNRKSKKTALSLGVTLLGLIIAVQNCVWAESAAPSLSNDELYKITQRLETEVQDLKGTVEKQNEVIEALKSKVDIKGPAPAASEKPKKRTAKENFRYYLLEKSESLPKPEEKQPVKAGMGSVEFGALVQEWYTFTDQRAKSNFRHRRVELGFSGRLVDPLKWGVVIDPALVREDNSTRSILKDIYLAYDGIPHHEIKLGQFKIPVTEEGFRSSALIDTIERSFVGTQFGDKRDIGLMASGKWKYLDYQVGVFNGDELNRFDTNDKKDIAARFVLKPFPDKPLLKGLEGGASMYLRTFNPERQSTKKRIGVEGRYEYKNLSLKAEYMKGEDGSTVANGWYVQAGYFLLPRWQPIVRFEGFNPNERNSASHEYDTTFGLNYFLVYPRTKLQFNYVHKDTAGINGASDEQLIAATQLGF